MDADKSLELTIVVGSIVLAASRFWDRHHNDGRVAGWLRHLWMTHTLNHWIHTALIRAYVALDAVKPIPLAKKILMRWRWPLILLVPMTVWEFAVFYGKMIELGGSVDMEVFWEQVLITIFVQTCVLYTLSLVARFARDVYSLIVMIALYGGTHLTIYLASTSVLTIPHEMGFIAFLFVKYFLEMALWPIQIHLLLFALVLALKYACIPLRIVGMRVIEASMKGGSDPVIYFAALAAIVASVVSLI